ncbi:putative dehydrogenase [Saccharothrix australiensis]|uniref:Putative dehydrogenase n=2 Tax=Saccharothrix australiensis TaxID=2072 RepID=A0A495W1N3_9PSEU|nr:Gfo/Idh/MocA family oxidoreductase [Saccharothrix australiensis]RKT55536.1 putative dehydrogenase [Saccharothrix australiensis]
MDVAVRLGVLGCADVAARRVLPAVARCSEVRLVAVASRDSAKAADFAGRFGCAAVTGYDALLAQDDVDAVYLPLPAALHARWVERALLAGKHVLAEKPLTTSAADTERLLGLAARLGLVLVENYMFLAHGRHAAVRRMVDDGAVGTPLAFGATFTIPPRPPGDIRLDPALGGGALLDTGGYPLRAALHFLGTGLSVAGAALSGDGRVELGGAALLTRADGVTAQLGFGLRHAYTSEYWFLGTEGRLTTEHVFTTPADHRPVVRLDRGGRREERVLPVEDQYAGAVRRFAEAVRAGCSPNTAATLAQAVVVDRITRAAEARTRHE